MPEYCSLARHTAAGKLALIAQLVTGRKGQQGQAPQPSSHPPPLQPPLPTTPLARQAPCHAFFLLCPVFFRGCLLACLPRHGIEYISNGPPCPPHGVKDYSKTSPNVKRSKASNTTIAFLIILSLKDTKTSKQPLLLTTLLAPLPSYSTSITTTITTHNIKMPAQRPSHLPPCPGPPPSRPLPPLPKAH